jgi:hypothetical protein
MSRWLRNPIRIVVIACLLRIGVVGAFFTHNKFSWGLNELAEIARALVEGRGFSSAFHGASGATAWFAPAYPALLALIFRIRRRNASFSNCSGPAQCDLSIPNRLGTD